jgi:hypothetical protein
MSSFFKILPSMTSQSDSVYKSHCHFIIILVSIYIYSRPILPIYFGRKSWRQVLFFFFSTFFLKITRINFSQLLLDFLFLFVALLTWVQKLVVKLLPWFTPPIAFYQKWWAGAGEYLSPSLFVGVFRFVLFLFFFNFHFPRVSIVRFRTCRDRNAFPSFVCFFAMQKLIHLAFLYTV